MKNIALFLLLTLPCYLIGQKNDSLTTNRSYAIYPAFGYQPETSVQLGVVAIWALKSKDRSQSTFHRQSSFSPFFLYTFKQQILSEFNLDYYFSNGNTLNISSRYFNFPDSYFGIGNENNKEDAESYTNVYFQAEGQLLWPLAEQVFLGTAFDIHHTKLNDIVSDGRLISDNVIGLDGGNIFGIGPALRFDTRNDVIYPTKGHLMVAQAVISNLGDFSYTGYTLDFRKYFQIKNDKNIIAFQLNANMTSGEQIPFYKLPQLGGANRLRGIANASLYRDRQSIFTQVEYRRQLFWRLGMVAFVGMGDVAPKLDDFNLSTFKYVAGLGYRFAVIPNQNLNFRFDFGISEGGQTGFYIGMREAF